MIPVLDDRLSFKTVKNEKNLLHLQVCLIPLYKFRFPSGFGFLLPEGLPSTFPEMLICGAILSFYMFENLCLPLLLINIFVG